VESVARYFDILSDARPDVARSGNVALAETAKTENLSWIPQWLALLAGVVIQPYFAGYQKTSSWAFAGFWGWLAASAIIALVVFPAVYRGAFDPTKPWIVQIVPIFTAGLGWNTLFLTAMKAATGR
jgi:hypothetical protein